MTIYAFSVLVLLRLITPLASIEDYINVNIVRISLLNCCWTVARTVGVAVIAVIFDISLSEYLLIITLVFGFELICYLVFRLNDRLRNITKKVELTINIDRGFVKDSVKIWVLVMLWNGLIHFEKIIVGGHLDSGEFGLYWIVSILAGAVMLVSGPLNSFVLPKLNRAKNSEFENSIILITNLYLWVVILPSVLAVLYQKEIFGVWLGRPLSDEYSLVFTNYMLGNIVSVMSAFAYFIRFREGIGTKFLSSSLIITLVHLIGIFYMADIYGAVGVSFLWLLFSLCNYFLLARPKIVSRSGLEKWEFEHILPLVFAFAVGFGLFSLIARSYLNSELLVLSSGAFAFLFLFMINGKWRLLGGSNKNIY